MRRFAFAAILAALLALVFQSHNSSHAVASPPPADRGDLAAESENPRSSSLVQIAILLDTSGSMEGLIDQARIQVWNVVNELAAAQRGADRADLEVAIIQYGTEDGSKSNGYIKRVLDFSGDLDEISRALFSLRAKGGVELCGEAIRQACDDLAWNADAGYRAVFIAGNEAFDQGETGIATVFPRLQSQNILVNTIYCRWKKAKPRENALWQYAAQLGSGCYAEIDHTRKMPTLTTPYDAGFRDLNRRMNESFVWYGDNADKHQRNQARQDANAKRMSNEAFASRMTSKIGHLYQHVHSDLVDALQHGHLQMEEITSEMMPEKLKSLDAIERMKLLRDKVAERETVRREMATLISLRQAWLAAHAPADSTGSATWGSALQGAVREQLESAGFETHDAS